MPAATSTCSSCQYFFVDNNECHRYPPTILQGSKPFPIWSIVEDSDWCGEYRAAASSAILLTSVTPNTLPAGSTPATIDVVGSGFDATSTVYVNGTARATFYLDTTHMQYTARPDLVTTPQTVQVTVANNTDTSNSLPFTYT